LRSDSSVAEDSDLQRCDVVLFDDLKGCVDEGTALPLNHWEIITQQLYITS
jgi:hypothetical protein